MVILKRQLHLHHWQGMLLIVVGAFVVGLSSVLSTPCGAEPHQHHHRHPDHPSHADYDYDYQEPYGSTVDHLSADDLSSHWSAPAWRQAALAAAGNQCGESSHALLGNLFVMAAQVFSALQFVVEEKYVKKYRMPALLAVGLEGSWGLILSCGFLPLCLHLQARPLADAAPALPTPWPRWRRCARGIYRW